MYQSHSKLIARIGVALNVKLVKNTEEEFFNMGAWVRSFMDKCIFINIKELQ